MPGLLIDLDGVVYEGDRPIHGAAGVIDWLEEQGIGFLFLTNTTSRPRRAIVDKLHACGISTDVESILTPPVAAARWIREQGAGTAALFVADATIEEFEGLEIADRDAADVAAVVVGDYGSNWSYAELNRAFRLLMQSPAPALVALGMTRYWKAEDGLRLDTGPFVAALSHATGVQPVVLGKPAPAFFEAALGLLGLPPASALMIGDDIQGDVRGAQAAGIAAALVRTGKYRQSDLDAGIRPEIVLGSIADVRRRWDEIVAMLDES